MDRLNEALAIEARAKDNPTPPADRAWLQANYPKRAARLEACRVELPPCEYATLASVGALEKPVVVSDLPALARRVHRLRRGASIQCVNAQLETSNTEPKPCVSVYALDDYGSRTRLLCHAFLRGRKAPTLMAALERAEPQPALTARVREL